ncbi:MAG: hypothetical protein AB1445_03080 [Bacillota bacterium]
MTGNQVGLLLALAGLALLLHNVGVWDRHWTLVVLGMLLLWIYPRRRGGLVLVGGALLMAMGTSGLLAQAYWPRGAPSLFLLLAGLVLLAVHVVDRKAGYAQGFSLVVGLVFLAWGLLRLLRVGALGQWWPVVLVLAGLWIWWRHRA